MKSLDSVACIDENKDMVDILQGLEPVVDRSDEYELNITRLTVASHKSTLHPTQRDIYACRYYQIHHNLCAAYVTTNW